MAQTKGRRHFSRSRLAIGALLLIGLGVFLKQPGTELLFRLVDEHSEWETACRLLLRPDRAVEVGWFQEGVWGGAYYHYLIYEDPSEVERRDRKRWYFFHWDHNPLQEFELHVAGPSTHPQRIWITADDRVFASLDTATGTFINSYGWYVDPSLDLDAQRDLGPAGTGSQSQHPPWADLDPESVVVKFDISGR